jgi:hypothetical protein
LHPYNQLLAKDRHGLCLPFRFDAPENQLQPSPTGRNPPRMLDPAAFQTDTDIAALASSHADTAIQTLAQALNGDDRSAAVVAAVSLLAISRGLPLQLVALDTAGIAVEVATHAEHDCAPRAHGESRPAWHRD